MVKKVGEIEEYAHQSPIFQRDTDQLYAIPDGARQQLPDALAIPILHRECAPADSSHYLCSRHDAVGLVDKTTGATEGGISKP